jgi:hypothetical protein
MKCSNCGAKHGCGCKKRVANDGTHCCTKCVHTHNQKNRSNKKDSILK